MTAALEGGDYGGYSVDNFTAFKTSLSDSGDSSTDVLGELASFQTSVHIYQKMGLTYQKTLFTYQKMGLT
jgi:hypothetical protein